MAENAYLEFGGDPSGPKIDKLSGSKDFNFSCRATVPEISVKTALHREEKFNFGWAHS